MSLGSRSMWLRKGRLYKLLIIIMVAGIAVFLFYYFFVKAFSQISPAQAQQACEELFSDAKSRISGVPGFKIVKEGKKCVVEEDEMHSKDYILYSSFRVSRIPEGNGPSSVSTVKSNIEYLIAKLPRKDHWLWLETLKDYTLRVVNEPSLNGHPETYCITTQMYLNNDGSYIDQDPSHNQGGYIKPGSIPEFNPCSDLDK